MEIFKYFLIILGLFLFFHTIFSYRQESESDFQVQKLLDGTMSRVMELERHPRGVADALKQFWNNRPRPPFLPDMSALRQILYWKSESVNSFAVCSACKAGFGLFLHRARTWWVPLPRTMRRVISGCVFFRIASREVCSGLIKRYGPMLHFIANNRTELTSSTFCGASLQSFGCSASSDNLQWSIEDEIEATLTSTELELKMKGAEVPELSKNSSITRILHLTDIHVDPAYKPGSMRNCQNELCCRGFPNTSVVTINAEDKAGFFGDYNKCDLPLHSFQDALDHMSTTHTDIELIYMTGDLVPHNSWATSIETNQDTIAGISAWIKEYFPKTRVIPVLGNHEPHPANLFSPKGAPAEFSTDWVYATTAKAWRDWVPQESLQTFQDGGFYDVKISEKFRVVVLNTNVCNPYNFWQMYEHRDPGGQLKWLIQVLNSSELEGEKVHILGHVPPSQNECWSIWGRNFYRIVNRFKSTITAQFYGHTHYDEFQLYYDQDGNHKPINPVWIGASLTPYSKLNPGYKIYDVDGARGINSTWNVLDHETWIYNLKEANMNPKIPPKWFKLYKASEVFDIPNVLPISLNKFVNKLARNLTLFEKYYRYYHKESDESMKQECDATCRKQILCAIVTPYFSEETECTRIKLKVDGFILPQVIIVDL